MLRGPDVARGPDVTQAYYMLNLNLGSTFMFYALHCVTLRSV